jgi:hydroxymethylbilane synthase
VLALCGLQRLGKAAAGQRNPVGRGNAAGVAQGAWRSNAALPKMRLAPSAGAVARCRHRACVGAERAMLAALDGSCRTPIAGFATIDGDR